MVSSTPYDNRDTNLAVFDAQTAATRQNVLNDTAIDDISRQELLASLDSKRGAVGGGSRQDIINVSQTAITQTDEALALARSDDPLYKGRRFTQDMHTMQEDRPGRQQTLLTERTNTDQGTPTMLTSNPSDNLVPQANTLLTSGGP